MLAYWFSFQNVDRKMTLLWRKMMEISVIYFCLLLNWNEMKSVARECCTNKFMFHICNLTWKIRKVFWFQLMNRLMSLLVYVTRKTVSFSNLLRKVLHFQFRCYVWNSFFWRVTAFISLCWCTVANLMVSFCCFRYQDRFNSVSCITFIKVFFTSIITFRYLTFSYGHVKFN